MHGGGAGDDAKLVGVEVPELGDHLFGQPVAEVLLVGVAAQVLEGQHRQHHLLARRPENLAQEVAAHSQACENNSRER